MPCRNHDIPVTVVLTGVDDRSLPGVGGADFIADLLKAYEFEYVSFNPGASYRGVEESIVNCNDNQQKVIQTGHKGLSVSIAHDKRKPQVNHRYVYCTMLLGNARYNGLL